MSRLVMTEAFDDLPEHPVDSRWLWKGDPGEPDTFLTVIKVTKNTVTMRADEGWTVCFGEKRKALRSGKLVRLVTRSDIEEVSP